MKVRHSNGKDSDTEWYDVTDVKVEEEHRKLCIKAVKEVVDGVSKWNCDDDLKEWDVEAYIVAVQSNGSGEVRVFNMLNKEELLKRENLINNTLSEISYHIQSGNWEHTRNYYENEGIEEL